MNRPPLINIINSCYNPTEGWAEEFIVQAQKYQQLLSDNYTVCFVLVNDGSTVDLEGSIAIIKSQLPDFEFISYSQNKGKGYALRYGVEHCKGDYYCYTDVDFPYAAESLLAMIETMDEQGADLVMGRRDEAYFKSIPFQRRIISKMLIFVNKWILRLGHPDTQCGIKLINPKGKSLFLMIKTNGFLFEVDFVLQSRNALRVATTPVELRSTATLNNIRVATLVKLFKEYVGIRNRKSS